MESKTYKLSIIIPLYNSELFISNTLDNIISNYPVSNDVEIVLIDDGSTDGTSMICSNYCGKYDYIHYYKKENGGIASSRNKAIEVAKGDYLFFHDHDDLLCSNKIVDVLNVLNNEADLFLFNSNRQDVNGVFKSFIVNNTNYVGKYLNKSENDYLLATLFKAKQFVNICNRFGNIWSVIINKSFVVKNHLAFKTIVSYEDDFNFLFEILLNNPRIYVTGITIYLWKNRPTSSTYTFQYPYNYCEKLDIHRHYVDDKLKNFDCLYLKQKDINNFYWLNSYYYLISYGKSLKKNDYQSFKDFICLNNLRDRITVPTSLKKTSYANIVCFLFLLNAYSTLLFFIQFKK